MEFFYRDEAKNEWRLKKMKEIESKIIGFLKFSLNQIFFEKNLSGNYIALKNKIFEDSFVIIPDYIKNCFIFQKYIDNTYQEVSFSKDNVILLY